MTKFNWIRNKQPATINIGTVNRNWKVTPEKMLEIVSATENVLESGIGRNAKIILNNRRLTWMVTTNVFCAFSRTSNWSRSVENTEWLNAHKHVKRIEWSAVLGESKNVVFCQGNWKSPKTLDLISIRLMMKPPRTWTWFLQNEGTWNLWC